LSTKYNTVSLDINKLITRAYSTSFFHAARRLKPEMRYAIYSIYGFVRLADEIVDTFHEHNKKNLLEEFEIDYYKAYNAGISLNPVLHAFQQVVKKYNITDDLIHAFLQSMKYDLHETDYSEKTKIDKYIHGSAEVVGLMCLKVFTDNNDILYNELKDPAMKLGSAFQKINFLRDLKNDMEYLGRNYFPLKKIEDFNETTKEIIIANIENDFSSSLTGIRKLPGKVKLPVLTAYYYNRRLLKKISHTPANEIIHKRIRISNFRKILLYIKAFIACKINYI